MIGHKLTIKGEGLKGDGYLVSLDDQELACSSVDLHIGVQEATTATITLFVNELDASAVPDLVATR